MWTVVRHFKGAEYLQLGEARNSEDLSTSILYLSLYKNSLSSLWTRPKDMFLSMMENGSPRFEPVYMIRKAAPDDISELLSFGYDAWGNGKSMPSFLESYNLDQNHLRGQRYLIETLSGEILANLNTLILSKNVIGIASVATKPSMRKKGHAALLIKAVMELLRLENSSYTFMLFSEISPTYYEKLGFTSLPSGNQKFLPSVAMSNGSRDLQSNELALMEHYF